MSDTLQKLGMAVGAAPMLDPGNAGSIVPVADSTLAVLTFTTTGATSRTLRRGGYRGQMVMMINRTGSDVTVADDGSSPLALTISDNETALCVYTGEDDVRWAAILFKAGTVT